MLRSNSVSLVVEVNEKNYFFQIVKILLFFFLIGNLFYLIIKQLFLVKNHKLKKRKGRSRLNNPKGNSEIQVQVALLIYSF